MSLYTTLLNFVRIFRNYLYWIWKEKIHVGTSSWESKNSFPPVLSFLFLISFCCLLLCTFVLHLFDRISSFFLALLFHWNLVVWFSISCKEKNAAKCWCEKSDVCYHVVRCCVVTWICKTAILYPSTGVWTGNFQLPFSWAELCRSHQFTKPTRSDRFSWFFDVPTRLQINFRLEFQRVPCEFQHIPQEQKQLQA